MPAIGLLFTIQVAFAIHAVRTGRELFWVFIIVFIPAIGCVIYFFTQILPDLEQSQVAKKAGDSLVKAIDPQRELRRRKTDLEVTDTIENRIKLADECIEMRYFDEAISLLQTCDKNTHQNDPHILLRLAKAQFGDGQFDATKRTLERLIKVNPSFTSHEGHLLYARSLEKTGRPQQALEEYEVLSRSYPGEEGRVRYALLLKDQGNLALANEVFKDSLNRFKQATRYYKKKERHWINIAKQNVMS